MDAGNSWTGLHTVSNYELVKPEPLYTRQTGDYGLQSAPVFPNNIDPNSQFLYSSIDGVQPSLVGSAVAASMGTLPSNYDAIQADGMAAYSHEVSDLLYYSNHNQNTDMSEFLPEEIHLADMSANQPGFRPKTQRDLSSDSYVDFQKLNHPGQEAWAECCQSAQPTEDQQNWLRQNHPAYSLCLEQARIPSLLQQMAQKKHRMYGRKSYIQAESSGDICNFNGDAGTEFRNVYNQLTCYNETNNRIIPSPADIYQPPSHPSRQSDEPEHFQYASRQSRTKVWKEKTRLEREEEEKLSKDEKKAKDLNLPLVIEEIVNLPIDEFNEKLSKYEMTENQVTLARDIRRRGKNKVAAQNCRKRKIEQISDLERQYKQLKEDRKTEQQINEALRSERNHIKSIRDKLQRYLQEIEYKM